MEAFQQSADEGQATIVEARDDAVDPAAMADAAARVFQSATGFMVSAALHVAVALGVPDELDRPKSAAELAATLRADPDAMTLLLRTLAEAGILVHDADGLFHVTLAGSMLRGEAPVSLKPFVSWIANPFHFRTYAELVSTVRTGRAAVEHVFGSPVFDHFAHDHELAATFTTFMTVFAAAPVPAILEAYDFSGIETLVDVGGAHGHLLTAILARYPGINGVVFDLDQMIEGARARVQREGLAHRCRTVAGDFFVEVPPSDAYLLRQIIHDWNDERALRILRNVRAGLGQGERGRLLLIETVVVPGRASYVSERIGLEMLTVHGGRERTEVEFRALLRQAGFDIERIVPLPPPLSLIEARPLSSARHA
jgi:O-methyltransferase domain/Dimerisation domain